MMKLQSIVTFGEKYFAKSYCYIMNELMKELLKSSSLGQLYQ